MMKKKETGMQSSKAERRKKFGNWYDPRFLESQWRHGLIKSKPFYSKSDPSDEMTPIKGITNSQRKSSGFQIDPSEEPVPCDGCGKLTNLLTLYYIEEGSKIKPFYFCEECKINRGDKV